MIKTYSNSRLSLDRLETRVDDQDKRFWTLITGAFLALFGLLAKMAFFPGKTPLS